MQKLVEPYGNSEQLQLLQQFNDFEEFTKWYQNLVPEEPLDLVEVASIYFNLEFLTENFLCLLTTHYPMEMNI